MDMAEYECFSSSRIFKQRFPSSMLLYISSLVSDGEDEELAPEVRPLGANSSCEALGIHPCANIRGAKANKLDMYTFFHHGYDI